jgi:hypothetical protein
MNGSDMKRCLAFFVTPHGFGHAARACSVIDALYSLNPGLKFLVISIVPEWFFASSLSAPFKYFAWVTDIGLVQSGPLHENIPQTIKKLDSFFPIKQTLVKDAIRLLENESCDLIVNDISPLGIAVGHEAGIPSLLIENFTWDWIYSGYEHNGFGRHIRYLNEIYARVDYHIAAEPVCLERNVDLTCNPVCRPYRTENRVTRSSLGVGEQDKIVLITMGGIRDEFKNLDLAKEFSDLVFIIPGSREIMERQNNIIFLPFRSRYYHPDLIEACNVVVGKVGYSTLAEVYQSGKPFGYIPRDGFRESDKLVSYIKSKMAGLVISEDEFRNGHWLDSLEELLKLAKIERKGPSGAGQAATFIQHLLR